MLTYFLVNKNSPCVVACISMTALFVLVLFQNRFYLINEQSTIDNSIDRVRIIIIIIIEYY